VHACACACAQASSPSAHHATPPPPPRVFQTLLFHRWTCAFIMELINSRCVNCSPQMHQCSGCFSNDQTVKKKARAEKKKLSAGLIRTPVAIVLDDFDSLDASIAVSPAIVDRVVNQIIHLSPTRAPSSPVPSLQSSTAAAFRHGFVSPPFIVSTPPGFVSPPPGFVSPPPSISLNYDGDHVFPAMGDAAPLSVNSQVLFPIPASNIASKASAATMLPAKRKDKFDMTSSDSGSGSGQSDSSSQTGEDEHASLSKKTRQEKKKKMPRISKEERLCVCDWIRKLRKDQKMLNGRWIRNGGAKGQTMTATSSEVKTSGAHEALAMCARTRVRFSFDLLMLHVCAGTSTEEFDFLPLFGRRTLRKRDLQQCP
jgi:hypothetical protein